MTVDSPVVFGIAVSSDAALQRSGIIVALWLFWALLGGRVLYVLSSWFYRFHLLSFCPPNNALATALYSHPHAPTAMVPLDTWVL